MIISCRYWNISSHFSLI